MHPMTPFRLALRLLSTTGLALGLATLAAAATTPRADEAFGVAGPPRITAPKAAPMAPSRLLHVDVSRAPQTSLSLVDREQLAREDALVDRLQKKAIRYGIGRAVTLGGDDGEWTDLADGRRLWVAELTSPEAIGLRLHLVGVNLPPGAQLAVYAADLGGHDPAVNPVEAYGGPFGFATRELWTGSMPGERARIEYLAPAGSAPGVPFAIDRLQHLYRDPLQVAKDVSGSCESDVACSPDYLPLSHAVAGWGQAGTNALFCTGTLLNTQASDYTPYLLTANHCTEDPTESPSPSAIEVYWNYQAASCGGAPASIFDVKRSRHTTRISTNAQSDYTLLLIDGAIPSSELAWSGWTGEPVADGTSSVGIHHPNADEKKISFGNVDGSLNCAQYFPGRSVVPIGWHDGVTEPGSSGSGIFRIDTQQLFGQLFGGPSSCEAPAPDRFDCYGSFAVTYPHIAAQLEAGSDDRSENNDTCSQAKSLRVGRTRGLVLKVTDPDWYKVFVPTRNTAQIAATFVNAYGDVDIAAYASCDPAAAPLVVSATTHDGELVSVHNGGKKGIWVYVKVYFGDEDTRANYDMNVTLHRTGH